MMLHGKRVLITGGAGLVGSAIADRLVSEDPAEIRVLDNFERGRMTNLDRVNDRGLLTIVDGDIRDPATVRDAMCGVEVVFHQAAIRITQCAVEPRRALEVMVDGTFNVAEAAVNEGVAKVVAASSASVYGQASTFPTHEDHAHYANRTFYGAAKTFNEGLLRSFHEMYGLDYVALRYFNVYGPRMDVIGLYTEVLIRWIERIARGEPPLILGDGEQTMDFVYVDDVAEANVAAAKAPATDIVCNVAPGNETSLKELAILLLRVMHSDLHPEFGPERAVNDVARRLASTDRARKLLGFEAKMPLEEGLRRLVAWWQAEQAEQAVDGAAAGREVAQS